MNKISNFLKIILILFISINLRAQNELNPEINKIENQIKYDVENSLRSVLGNQVPLSVFVKFEIDRTPTSAEEPTSPPQETATESETTKLDYFETGYMSLPTSVLPLNRKQDSRLDTQKAVNNKDEKIKFKNLFVDLLIGNDISKDLEKQVQQTVQSLLASYNPQIRVQRLAMYKPPEEKPKEEAKKDEEKKTTSPEPERKPSADEQLKQAELNAPWWQKFSYQILLASGVFAFLVGLILFSRSLKSGFAILSEGLAAAAAKTNTTQIEATPLSLPTADAASSNASQPNSNTQVDEVEVSELDISSNLIIIQNMVKEQPEAILSSVNDSYEDYKGIRWLLTHIEVQSRQTLRDLLGEAFFISRNEIKYFNPRAWLQDFTERLVLAQVAKSGSLNKILSQEQIHKIYHFSREI